MGGAILIAGSTLAFSICMWWVDRVDRVEQRARERHAYIRQLEDELGFGWHLDLQRIGDIMRKQARK